MTYVLVAAGLALVAWLAVRWERRLDQARDRRRLEDALKHLFDQEYRGRRGSLSSLTGALRVGDGAVLALVGLMQAQGLVTTAGQEFQLTPAGERLALQVVRAHRLLERYLVDEARLHFTPLLREGLSLGRRKRPDVELLDPLLALQQGGFGLGPAAAFLAQLVLIFRAEPLLQPFALALAHHRQGDSGGDQRNDDDETNQQRVHSSLLERHAPSAD